jgi:mRNA interferase MazF
LSVTTDDLSNKFSDHRVIGNWQGAGLLKASVIKPIVMTVESNLIRKTLGKLQAQDHQTPILFG